MTEGWIKLHRQLKDHEIMKKHKYLAVWNWCLLSANHQEKKIIWNNQKRTIPAGGFITSQRKIATELGLSISTVNRVLKYLKTERMVEHQTTSRFTFIYIVNWERYQGGVERKVKRQSKASRTPVETNNNDKNEKNVNNNISNSYKKLLNSISL